MSFRQKKVPIAIGVDLDGTLFKEDSFPGVGEPFYERCWLINYLYEQGITVVIWTLRTEEKGTAKAAKDALKKVGVNWDYWNETPEFVQKQWGDQRKPGLHYFIDDRNAGGIPDIITILGDILHIASKEVPHWDDHIGIMNIDRDFQDRVEHLGQQEYYYSLGDKRKIKWLESRLKELDESCEIR